MKPLHDGMHTVHAGCIFLKICEYGHMAIWAYVNLRICEYEVPNYDRMKDEKMKIRKFQNQKIRK
jgi:hypothetical protein